MKVSPYLAIATFLFASIGGCSRVESDYKALGFSSAAEMEVAFSKGYHTKQKMDEMTKSTSPQAAPVATSHSPRCAGSLEPLKCEALEAEMAAETTEQKLRRQKSPNVERDQNLAVATKRPFNSEETHVTAQEDDDNTVPTANESNRMMGRKEALSRLMKKTESDPKFRDAPEVLKAFTSCISNAMVDAIFIDGVTKIAINSFDERLKHLSKSGEDVLKEGLEGCGAIVDHALQEAKSSAQQPPLIDIDDFRLDYLSLVGKKIRVAGVGYFIMSSLMLKKNQMDLSPILIDISKVPRSQQKRIMQDCADIRTGCKVVVYGVVGNVAYQNGILADGIEW